MVGTVDALRKKEGKSDPRVRFHYSGTCLERQEGRPTTWLSELERSHVGLKFGSHLLETIDRQMISGAQIVLVVVLVYGAIS